MSLSPLSKTSLLLACCLSATSAMADVRYTTVMSLMRDAQLSPLSTVTTSLKEGLQRIETKTEVGAYRSLETSITDVAKNQRLTLDWGLKIYYSEPLSENASDKGAASGAKPVAAPRPAASGKKSKLVMTLGAQFLGTEKMLDLPARHYKTSMQIDQSGDCGTSDVAMKSEVWMADLKLPVLKLPNQNGGASSYGATGSDGCAVTTETKGDPKGFEAAQKGLALKTIQFDKDGKVIAQHEITMLSSAALSDSEFAVPADYGKMTREEFNEARQKAMMSAFTQKAASPERASAQTPAPAEAAPAEAPQKRSLKRSLRKLWP